MPDLSNLENQNNSTTSEFSLAAIRKKGAVGLVLRLLAPLVDRLLGLRRFQIKYVQDGLPGLERYAFLEKLIKAEHIQYAFDQTELARIPQQGPVIIVANHPMGGLEGIILMWILRQVRPDYKFFVNVLDSFIVELKEFFIYTNPMAKGSLANHTSIRLSREWIAQGHCLVVFPAGRVGIYRSDKGYVTDEPWDEIALRLGIMTGAKVIPLFVAGECSRFFSFMSRYIYPMKLFLLGWEFLKSFKKRVVFHIGHPIPASRLAAIEKERANDWLRMRIYLECPDNGLLSAAPGSGDAAARAAALADFAKRCREGVLPRRPRNVKQQRGVLHPEVEDYIVRYGLTEQEIGELTKALDNKG